MTPSLRGSLRLICVLGISHGVFCSRPAPAQPSAGVPSPKVETRALPPLPVMKSPVESFRELLAMPAGERERSLTNRPPAIRRRILEKLREYETMKPEERDLRLRMTELRWYLLAAIQNPPGAREAELAMIPEADRQLVRDRLEQWDRLPATEQKEVLKYETTMRYFVGPGSETATNRSLQNIPAPERQEAARNLDAWLKLPPAQRAQTYASFQKFFELTDKEKQKTMGFLPIAERVQMAHAVQVFMHLPQGQREVCLRSFNQLAGMTEPERREFFKNAERWREMPAAERQAWRNLVNRLPPLPPLPPGIGTLPIPPMPPMLPLRPHLPAKASLPVATNSSP